MTHNARDIANLKRALDQFTGSEVVYRHPLSRRIRYTEGVQYLAEMAQCFWYLDASKAERELGWRARDPGETLHDTVEDLRARGVVWPRDDARDGARADGVT